MTAKTDAAFLTTWADEVLSNPAIHQRARRVVAAVQEMRTADALTFVTAILMNVTTSPSFPDEE